MIHIVYVHHTNDIHDLYDGFEQRTIDRVKEEVIFWTNEMVGDSGWDMVNWYSSYSRVTEYKGQGLEEPKLLEHSAFIFFDKRDADLFSVRWN